MKRLKVLAMLLAICCLFAFSAGNTAVVSAATSGQWNDVGSGWEFRVDPPHTENSNSKWHVHARNKQLGKSGSEAVDGSPSHGDNMNDVPKKVKDKIKKHPEYEKGKQKQKKLDEAAKQIKAKGLKIDWAHIGDVTLAIGIVVACTATFFFQGDDIAAWMNLLRAIGC